jgi:hypothetical protein
MATVIALKHAAEFSSETDNYLPLADAVHQVRCTLAGKNRTQEHSINTVAWTSCQLMRQQSSV